MLEWDIWRIKPSNALFLLHWLQFASWHPVAFGLSVLELEDMIHHAPFASPEGHSCSSECVRSSARGACGALSLSRHTIFNQECTSHRSHQCHSKAENALEVDVARQRAINFLVMGSHPVTILRQRLADHDARDARRRQASERDQQSDASDHLAYHARGTTA